MFCSEILEDNKIRCFQISRKQYYTDIGSFKGRQKIKTWSKTIKKELEALSQVSYKGVSLGKHYDYLETYLAISDALWNEYSKESGY